MSSSEGAGREAVTVDAPGHVVDSSDHAERVSPQLAALDAAMAATMGMPEWIEVSDLEKRARIFAAALEAAAPHLAAAPRCPTGCDDDCEQACHEAHKPRWKRDHDPEQCAAAIVAAAVAAERERCAHLAEQHRAHYGCYVGVQAGDAGSAVVTSGLRPFAALLRRGGESSPR